LVLKVELSISQQDRQVISPSERPKNYHGK
jgi:hypothetical protein